MRNFKSNQIEKRQNSSRVERHDIHGQVDFPMDGNMNKEIRLIRMHKLTDRWTNRRSVTINHSSI
jgi:hypothetical protein